MACMAPRPRTSPISGQRSCHLRARSWKISPNSLARADKSSRRHDETAFTQYRFSDYCRNFFIGDEALERILKVARAEDIARGICQRIRTSVAVGVWDTVNLTRKRREPRFVWVRLAGKRQRQHRAPVKGIFKSNDGGTARVSTGDLDR